MLKFKKKMHYLFTAIVHMMTSILCYVIIYEQVTNKCHYLFTAIVHMMTSILCNVIIYEKVTNKCAKNRQYLKKRISKNGILVKPLRF